MPPELLDPEASCWRTEAEALAWCARHGVNGERVCQGVRSRFLRARSAVVEWTVAAGHVSKSSPLRPDREFMAAAGLDAAQDAALRLYAADFWAREARTERP